MYTDSITEDLARQTIEQNPALIQGLNGSLRISPESRDAGNDIYQNLLNQWPSFKSFQQSINERLEELDVNDIGLRVRDGLFEIEEGERLGEMVPYAYDAVVSAVLALRSIVCHEADVAGELDNHVFHLHQSQLSGGSIYKELTSADFEFAGTSGRVKFDNYTGSRSKDTSTFAMANLLVRKSWTEESQMEIEVEARQVAFWTPESKWSFNQSGTIVFSGGVTVPPLFTAPATVDYELIEGESS